MAAIRPVMLVTVAGQTAVLTWALIALGKPARSAPLGNEDFVVQFRPLLSEKNGMEEIPTPGVSLIAQRRNNCQQPKIEIKPGSPDIHISIGDIRCWRFSILGDSLFDG